MQPNTLGEFEKEKVPDPERKFTLSLPFVMGILLDMVPAENFKRHALKKLASKDAQHED